MSFWQGLRAKPGHFHYLSLFIVADSGKKLEVFWPYLSLSFFSWTEVEIFLLKFGQNLVKNVFKSNFRASYSY